MKLFSSLILIFALIGMSVQCHAAHNVRIGFYGDSTTWGTTQRADGTYYRSDSNETETVRLAFIQRYGNTINYNRVFVENHGVPGSKCLQWVQGTGDVTQTWEQEMAEQDLDIVVMNIGLNDATHLSDTDFQGCITEMARIALKYNVHFVLESPNPVNANWNSAVWGYQHDLAYLAGTLQLQYIDQWSNIMNNVPNWQSMIPDTVHPNDQLYTIKGTLSAQVLGPMVDLMLTY